MKTSSIFTEEDLQTYFTNEINKMLDRVLLEGRGLVRSAEKHKAFKNEIPNKKYQEAIRILENEFAAKIVKFKDACVPPNTRLTKDSEVTAMNIANQCLNSLKAGMDLKYNEIGEEWQRLTGELFTPRPISTSCEPIEPVEDPVPGFLFSSEIAGFIPIDEPDAYYNREIEATLLAKGLEGCNLIRGEQKKVRESNFSSELKRRCIKILADAHADFRGKIETLLHEKKTNLNSDSKYRYIDTANHHLMDLSETIVSKINEAMQANGLISTKSTSLCPCLFTQPQQTQTPISQEDLRSEINGILYAKNTEGIAMVFAIRQKIWKLADDIRTDCLTVLGALEMDFNTNMQKLIDEKKTDLNKHSKYSYINKANSLLYQLDDMIVAHINKNGRLSEETFTPFKRSIEIRGVVGASEAS